MSKRDRERERERERGDGGEGEEAKKATKTRATIKSRRQASPCRDHIVSKHTCALKCMEKFESVRLSCKAQVDSLAYVSACPMPLHGKHARIKICSGRRPITLDKHLAQNLRIERSFKFKRISSRAAYLMHVCILRECGAIHVGELAEVREAVHRVSRTFVACEAGHTHASGGVFACALAPVHAHDHAQPHAHANAAVRAQAHVHTHAHAHAHTSAEDQTREHAHAQNLLAHPNAHARTQHHTHHHACAKCSDQGGAHLYVRKRARRAVDKDGRKKGGKNMKREREGERETARARARERERKEKEEGGGARGRQETKAGN
eukprot:6209088-Pleurochrysis_carterae.AAC.1